MLENITLDNIFSKISKWFTKDPGTAGHGLAGDGQHFHQQSRRRKCRPCPRCGPGRPDRRRKPRRR